MANAVSELSGQRAAQDAVLEFGGALDEGVSSLREGKLESEIVFEKGELLVLDRGSHPPGDFQRVGCLHADPGIFVTDEKEYPFGPGGERAKTGAKDRPRLQGDVELASQRGHRLAEKFHRNHVPESSLDHQALHAVEALDQSEQRTLFSSDLASYLGQVLEVPVPQPNVFGNSVHSVSVAP